MISDKRNASVGARAMITAGSERAHRCGFRPWPLAFLAGTVTMLACLAPMGLEAGGGESPPFMRGDSNADGRVSVSDVLMLRRWMYNGDLSPTCLDAADAGDDGLVNIADPVYIMNALFAGGQAIADPSGRVGPDPTPDEFSCDAYEVEAAEESEDTVRIGEISAVPGALVEIPVFLSNTIEIEAFQLLIRYDPAVLEFEHHAQLVLEGGFYEGIDEDHYNIVRGSYEEGLLAIGYVPSLVNTGFEVPPGEDRLVFRIAAEVRDTVEPGTAIELSFADNGDEGFGEYGLRNELTHHGAARYATVIPRVVDGLLRIVGDHIFFRGDANGDAGVNVADAQFTLNYLFGSGPAPFCRDAADANDDGVLNVSDPIATLTFLFDGSASLPPPHPESGPDPTADALDCATGTR